MDRYKKYAYVIQIAAIFISGFVMMLTVMHWFFPHTYEALYATTGIACTRNFDVSLFSWAQKISGFIVEAVASALIVYGCAQVIRLMQYMKQQKYFTKQTLVIMKKITQTALAYTIYEIVSNCALNFITSLHHAPGQRVIALSFGSSDVINILVFCSMVLMVTMMQKGYELQHEQELTI